MSELIENASSSIMEAERYALETAAQKALALRRADKEILTYELDGWVVREHPGHRIERLAPIGQYRNELFPYPSFDPSV